MFRKKIDQQDRKIKYVTRSFSLHEEADCSIIEWLNNQPNTSSVIREALVEMMAGSEGQHSQITEILTILRDLQSRPFVITREDSIRQADEFELELAETKNEIENLQAELAEERKGTESLQAELGAYNEAAYTLKLVIDIFNLRA